MDNIPTKECPNKCQICQDTMSDAQEFYDFRAFTGNWYDGCVSCWRAHGVGLGVGKGQRYERQEDAKSDPAFLQTAGGIITDIEGSQVGVDNL